MTHDLQFSNNVLKSKRNRELLESAVTGWQFTAEVLSNSISVLHLITGRFLYCYTLVLLFFKKAAGVKEAEHFDTVAQSATFLVI